MKWEIIPTFFVVGLFIITIDINKYFFSANILVANNVKHRVKLVICDN
ncbi:MAG: hypothetical protein ABIG64_01975 [Candidatus Omnitrophota bacterium]